MILYSNRSVGGAMLGELKILGMQQKDRKLHYNNIVQQLNKFKSQIDNLNHHLKNKYPFFLKSIFTKQMRLLSGFHIQNFKL